ncbi:hypothetical protein F0919_17400 [Taibaiella lutea]|uniref:Uncharacterized protein n=1 Tax=Taibaiella lutea TaxID=2608001 RepID=A0A5M6CBI4_9BACT|nr:hypothetical protein [Taibaiella lutea]KAA5532558.1 hypothetical protein F0919_17400 [Taibaiella lutea]
MIHLERGVIVSFVFEARGRARTAGEFQLHPFLCPKTTTKMNENGKSLMGCLTIIFTVATGYVAWQKIHPNDLLSFIGFLIMWFIIAFLVKHVIFIVVGALLAILSKLLDKN